MTRFAWSILAMSGLLFAAGCEKVPLLAPNGSFITLTASATALSANGNTTLVAQVIEAAGTPPHSGTRVTFITTLGRIEPRDAETDTNGRAVATFIAGGTNGTATISALSGGATTGSEGAVTIAVGTAAVSRVNVTANPSTVPANGGSTVISAYVLDVNGNPLVATPVSFATTAGVLSSSLVSTDGSGNASTTLTTSQQATVTASVGAPGSGSTSGQTSSDIIVNVSSAPTVTITPPSTTITKGQSASFALSVTTAANSAAVRDVTINWGDGKVESLGAAVGQTTQQHVFTSDGPFRVTATATDVAGVTSSSSTSVVVAPAAQPTVTITAPATVTRGVSASFTFTSTVSSSGSPIREVTVNWGDGTIETIGPGTSGQTHRYTAEGTYRISATAIDALGSSGTASTTITVLPLAQASINIVPSPTTAAVNATITFTITITPPTGLGIQSASINYGDGTIDSLGATSSATVFHAYASAGTKTVTVTVIDTSGQSTPVSRNIVITP